MKRTRFVVHAILLLIVLCFSVTTLNAASNNGNGDGDLWGKFVSEEIDITLKGSPKMTIVIEHRFGSINVIKGDNSKIRIRGEKKVSARDDELAKEYLDNIELVIKESSNMVSITTEYPEKRLFERMTNKIRNFSLSYTIEIPEYITLVIENRFGGLDLSALSGDFSIRNEFGDIKAYQLDGETEINNKFGAIKAENISGDTQINNEHGSCEIKVVTGNLNAKGSFGSINLTSVSGDADVTNSHAHITAKDVGGDCTFQTSFSRAYAENVRGSVTIENQHGPIEVIDVRKGAELHTSFSSLKASRIGEGVIATNQHGSITVTDILRNDSDQRRLVSLKTSFGTIRLAMAATLSAELTMSTSFGTFSSDFKFYTNLDGTELSSGSTQRMDGEIGSGKDLIDLEGSHGNIYLEKM